jgi:hypothetical protein
MFAKQSNWKIPQKWKSFDDENTDGESKLKYIIKNGRYCLSES